MAILEAIEVTKCFGGLIANNKISLSVKEGDIVGLIGPNGSGKSTFFSCISGFHKVSSGKVIFGGSDITGLSPHRICKLGIARTFQITEVFTKMTVLENVTVGAFKMSKDLASAKSLGIETLKLVGLVQKMDESSKGLSPPERRRLSFAMALATSPKLLMLDESMAGLLPVEISELLKLIRKINGEGITIIIIEHVMEAVMSIAETIVVLEAGKVIASGTPKDIAGNERVIEAYLGENYRYA